MHSGASGVASPQNVRKCVFTFYGRAAPVARERNPTAPLRPDAPLVPIFDVSGREELERYIVRLDIQIRVARFRT